MKSAVEKKAHTITQTKKISLQINIRVQKIKVNEY